MEHLRPLAAYISCYETRGLLLYFLLLFTCAWSMSPTPSNDDDNSGMCAGVLSPKQAAITAPT